jgi:hypothetical protein
MEALEKVEKDIKKPLLRSDKKNMPALLAEFDNVRILYRKGIGLPPLLGHSSLGFGEVQP